MVTEPVVRISIVDVPQVRDAIDRATVTIHALQEALIAERVGSRIGPGLLAMGGPEFARLWEETREQLRAEGLPMGGGEVCDAPGPVVPSPPPSRREGSRLSGMGWGRFPTAQLGCSAMAVDRPAWAAGDDPSPPGPSASHDDSVAEGEGGVNP